MVTRRMARRGVGVPFLIASLVLVVLAILGLALKHSTRGATRLGEGVIAGEKALYLARAALSEGWRNLNQHLAEGESQLKGSLGAPALSFSEPIELSFEASIVESMVGKTIELSDVTFKFYSQQNLLPNVPSEKYGLVKATASATIYIPALKRHVTKGVVEYREFKVIYAGPPQPFQRYSLFVLRPVHLPAYEKQYRQIQQQVDATLRKQGGSKVPRPFASNGRVYKYFDKYNYPPFPYNERALPSDCLEYPDGTIDLAKTDMDNPIYSLSKKLEGSDFKLKWPADIQNYGSASRESFQEVQRQYESRMKKVLADYLRKFPFMQEDTLEQFGDFHLSSLLNIDIEGNVSVDEPMALYRWCRATNYFPNQEEFWQKVRKADGTVRLNGIYFIDGPIDIDMQYRGSGTIVSRERVTVLRCVKADGRSASDVCTLITFSKPTAGKSDRWSSIELESNAHAALVAVTGMVRNLHLYDVHGSVAVGQLSREVIDGRGDGTSYPWSLTYDSALDYTSQKGTSLLTKKCQIIISPCLAGTRVVRRNG